LTRCKRTTFDEDHLAGFSYTMAYNLTGWPSVVVRGGTSPEGLPIGVQVVARPWREDVALALAKKVEAVGGGWQPPTLSGRSEPSKVRLDRGLVLAASPFCPSRPERCRWSVSHSQSNLGQPPACDPKPMLK
jgi:hypothetical protein